MGKDGQGPKHTPQPNRTAPNARLYNDERIFGGPQQSVDYDNVDGTEIAGFIGKVTRAGGCVIFGITSDGGAYSLTVIIGEKRWREWPNTTDKLLQAFAIVADQL